MLLRVRTERAVELDVAELDAVLAEVFLDHVNEVEAEVVLFRICIPRFRPFGGLGVEQVHDAGIDLVLVVVGKRVHVLDIIRIIQAFGMAPVADTVLGRHVHAEREMVSERTAVRIVGVHALPENLENVVVCESSLEVAGEAGLRLARDAVRSELVRLLHEGVESFEQPVFGVKVTLANRHDEVHLLFLGEVVLGGGVAGGVFHRHKSLFPASMVGHEC